jgi:phytoene desaturase
MKSVAIIGAGTAGLSAALRLQALGYQVTIFDKNPQVGGRIYQLRESGFQFDVGPTIVMMPEIYREVFTATGAKAEDYITLTALDPLYQLHYHDGDTLTISSNLNKLMTTLEKFSLKDAEGYLAYLANIYKRYNIARSGFIDRSFDSLSDILSIKNIINTLRLRTLQSAYQSISKFVKHEKLRQALSFQTLYIGVSPFVGPSIYTIISMIELLYGIWYIQGGMYQFAKAMEKRFLEINGTIKLNVTVDSIIIHDKVARGIVVNGQSLHFDKVLCNADFPYAMEHLINDAKDRHPYSKRKIAKMEYSSSSFIMYLGVNKKYPMSVHQIRYAKDFKKNIDDLFNSRIHDDPSFYIYSPTQIDPSLAPSGQEIIYVLVPVPNLEDPKLTWDEAMTSSLKEKILSRLTTIPGLEDLRDHIVVEKVYTPKTFKEQFNLHHGATFGFKPILLQSNFFRPQTRALKVKNLYFAGTSTHPGAGIPIVMKAAKIAVDAIVKDDQ